MVVKERERLEQVGGLTAQQAKEELMRVMEREARVEAAQMLKRIEDEAREHGAARGAADRRRWRSSGRPPTTSPRPRSRW